MHTTFAHYLQRGRQSLTTLLLLIMSGCFITVMAQPVTTPSGIRVKTDKGVIGIDVVQQFAFRVTISAGIAQPAGSNFLDNNPAITGKFSVINEPGSSGIRTSYGKVIVNTRSAVLAFFDGAGKLLFQSTGLATSDSLQVLHINAEPAQQLYGSGNYSTKNLVKNRSFAVMGNGTTDIPYYWCNKGYSLLGITRNDNKPATWKTTNQVTSWTFPGEAAELYCWPAADLYTAAKGFALLTGKPALPPFWAFGYLQSQWGWADRNYIEDVLKNFLSRDLPVDAFIYDFEWYTKTPDYAIGSAGEKDFSDFTFNPRLFPDPSGQIADYKKQGVKFIGIRKPRMGNSFNLDTAAQKGWLRHPGTGSRDMDFSHAGFQQWYAARTKPLLDAGVDAWWNDEGESYYTCYYWWNKTQADLLQKERPGERFFSLNRSFSPGNQRIGYCTWTGDIRSGWKDLREAPADILNFSLAGMNYGSCDIGGFSDAAEGKPTTETLVRWFEAGVFFPIMRAHSNIMTRAHFPWLWGAEAEVAIRKALHLRYRLLPYLYSLGHEAYATGVPMMRPLLMEFQQDSSLYNLTDEWLMGKGLLAAPLLDSGGARSIYLPADDWYDFFTGEKIKGPVKFPVTKKLDEIPVYVRAGTILPLGPVKQYTSQPVTEPLELRIYPGHNSTFTLVEDDGHTNNYQKGAVRKINFTWNDATKTLSWNITGKYKGPSVYKVIKVVLGEERVIAELGKRQSVKFKF